MKEQPVAAYPHIDEARMRREITEQGETSIPLPQPIDVLAPLMKRLAKFTRKTTGGELMLKPNEQSGEILGFVQRPPGHTPAAADGNAK